MVVHEFSCPVLTKDEWDFLATHQVSSASNLRVTVKYFDAGIGDNFTVATVACPKYNNGNCSVENGRHPSKRCIYKLLEAKV